MNERTLGILINNNPFQVNPYFDRASITFLTATLNGPAFTNIYIYGAHTPRFPAAGTTTEAICHVNMLGTAPNQTRIRTLTARSYGIAGTWYGNFPIPPYLLVEYNTNGGVANGSVVEIYIHLMGDNLDGTE